MKKIAGCFLFLFVLLSGYATYSQSKREENRKYEKEEDECNEALKLIKKAEKLWKDDEYTEAEKLCYESNRLCASYAALFFLATNKMELQDIKGANKVWDDQINSLQSMQPKAAIKQKEIDNVLGMAISRKINDNLIFGNPRIAIQTCIYGLQHPPPGNLFGKTMMQKAHYVDQYFQQSAEFAFQLEDKESLVKLQELLRPVPNNEGPMFFVTAYLNMLEGKYDEVIKAATQIAENGADFRMAKGMAKAFLPLVYSYKGDAERSEIEMQKIARKSIIAGPDWSPVISGRNALLLKNYKEGIEQLTRALHTRGIFKIIDPGRFANYTKRGECYEGLGDFKNAKKDFESALIYEPNYEPALQGLARLEGRINVEVRKDKTPPEIIIIEPSPATRGFEVTSADNDIMVRGIAKDSFGVKSVSINNNNVFLKQEGEFWGGIPLSAGINKITIEATDLAGNKSTKTIEIEKKTVVKEQVIPETGSESRNFALFIASQAYDDPSIPQLENPISDAVKLKLLLKNNYGFKDENIFTSFNPERSDIRQKLHQLTEELKPDDNLVIFYAGHGIWDKTEKKGYWLVTDALRSDKSTWLLNKEVLDLIAKIPSRHTLLITDACFSGGVFRTRGLGDMPPTVAKLNEKISRVAITSGNDTEVPDESIFMKYLIKALTENKEKYITAQKMFINQILEAVMTETKTEPRYGTLELAGHVGGDYIFIKN